MASALRVVPAGSPWFPSRHTRRRSDWPSETIAARPRRSTQQKRLPWGTHRVSYCRSGKGLSGPPAGRGWHPMPRKDNVEHRPVRWFVTSIRATFIMVLENETFCPFACSGLSLLPYPSYSRDIIRRNHETIRARFGHMDHLRLSDGRARTSASPHRHASRRRQT